MTASTILSTLSPEDCKAVAEIRRLYEGGTVEGYQPDDFAPKWQKYIADYYEDWQAGGTKLVKHHVEADAAQYPQLARVYADFIPKLDPWDILTVADARAPRPPIQELVKNLIRLPSLVIVAGDGGTLKSALMVDLAACIVAGAPWLPPLPNRPGTHASAGRRTLQGPVFWVDLDNGRETTLERVAAAANANSLPDDAPFYFTSMPDPWLNGANPDDMAALTERVQRMGVKLVIVDALADVRGDINENSSDMSNVLLSFRRLSEVAQAAVVILHHTRKGGANGGRAGDTVRGHSSIRNKVDLVLEVERETPTSDTVKLRSIKTRGPTIDPFTAIFTSSWKPGTRELDHLKFYSPPQEVQDVITDDMIDRVVLAVIQAQPCINQSNLKREIKTAVPRASTARLQERIAALIVLGHIQKGKGAKNADVYTFAQVSPVC